MRITRRRWTLLLSAAPLAAQSPAPPLIGKPPEPTLQKALDDVHQVSQRLDGLEVPMNVEPAFSFKV